MTIPRMPPLMDFGPSEERCECALDLRDRCGDSIIFGNPSLLRTCLRFPYCPFWDISHVMFISFCSVSYYLMNRYFPHVLHQRATCSAPAHSLSFFLSHSTTDLLQDSSANGDPTLCTELCSCVSVLLQMSQYCFLCLTLLLLLIE